MAASNENDNLMIDCDIIFTCENVSLYALVGTVNAEKDACLTERKTLQLLQTQHTNEGLYYLITIGENQLPLASHIPVLRTAKGNYIIPLEQSICYGIVFDVNTPDPFLKIFEDFLSGICTFRTKEQVEELSKLQKEHQQQAFQPQTQTQIQVNQTPINTQGISTTATIPQTTPQEDKPVSYMNSLAGYIKSGSTSLGEYIVKGSEYVGSALQSGGEKLKTHIPAGRHVPTHVPHVLHKTVHVAHAISPHTVKMSLGVLHGVSFVSRKIGGFVADKVSHSSLGKKLQEPSSPRVEAAKNVVGASVEGALVLWESLGNFFFLKKDCGFSTNEKKN